MKEQIMNSIVAVLNALNDISVSGKSNLSNLGGSIAVLEDIYKAVSHANITDEAPAAEHEVDAKE